jgi:hypothetical protein
MRAALAHGKGAAVHELRAPRRPSRPPMPGAARVHVRAGPAGFAGRHA